MVTVSGVVDRMSSTLLRVRSATGLGSQVVDIAIAEGTSLHLPAPGELVLGVAVTRTEHAADLIKLCAQQQGAGVLLKPPFTREPELRELAERLGTALVEVSPEAGWAQITWLLRTVLDAAMLADSEAADGRGDHGAATGDLFTLADAVAAVVDAPVTIEDAQSRVVAYSARQDRTDQARVDTIMGRRVPHDVLARFRSRGVFRKLSRGQSAIFEPAQPDGTLPRLIVPIRMGGELLGSMWAVVPDPVIPERALAFADAGPVVALRLLRWRATVDAEAARHQERVRLLLHGGEGWQAAAAELGCDSGRYRVVAIAPRFPATTPESEGSWLALKEQVARGIGRSPVVAESSGVLYAVVQAGADGRAALRALPVNTADSDSIAFTVGTPVEPGELPRSREQAAELLGLLRSELLPGVVAVWEEVWPAVSLHRLASTAARADLTDLGPLAVLAAHDTRHGTQHVPTLFAWLRHPGDPRTAGSELGIHPNTLRYRLKRLQAVIDLDLTDPDVRLALLMQLTIRRWARPGIGPLSAQD
ncbi:helix-turn-helix domain-containing protein [Actinoalloteichus hymeniacidonis]|uniref:Sugar diacid utilization regulator n=1 Tax=Actinoalloteichus hymeniacidonis TaxID=340345 RepID=A0AAC9HVP6_9PSEU|nr:PucR family transcriptional regulator [Actinoalloteichus hymeniacidonis]AOS65375.1 sugar diacid utilization regulator [Actinoalloteichus hymeniacidonis]